MLKILLSKNHLHHQVIPLIIPTPVIPDRHLNAHHLELYAPESKVEKTQLHS